MTCQCRLDSCGPAVAVWHYEPNGFTGYLCHNCLNAWFDNADDDPSLEPTSWRWLDSARRDSAFAIARALGTQEGRDALAAVGYIDGTVIPTLPTAGHPYAGVIDQLWGIGWAA